MGQYRFAVFSRHLAQATAACLTAMTQGNLTAITFGHWQVALTTGLATGMLGVIFTFGPMKFLQHSRWGVAMVALIGTSIADYFSHPSHFGGAFTEAIATGIMAAILSVLVSFTPIGKLIDEMVDD